METIIKKASELFFAYGVRSISMDDVAKSSGTSKKTLYQLVADKNELVDKVVEGFISCQAAAITPGAFEAKNAVEEVLKQTQSLFSVLSSVNISFFYDLEKFFPGAWQKLIEHKDKATLPCIIKNLERGIEEGLFRADLDIPFTAEVRLQQITTALHPDILTDKTRDAQKRMTALTDFYLHSITTVKGRQWIKKLNNKNENR